MKIGEMFKPSCSTRGQNGPSMENNEKFKRLKRLKLLLFTFISKTKQRSKIKRAYKPVECLDIPTVAF